MGDDAKAGASLSDQAIEWLVALDTGSADSQAFAAWRNADPRHAAVFAQVAATWRRTADPRLPALLDSAADLPATMEEEAASPAPILSRRAVAAGLVGLLGLGGAATFLAWPRRAFAETAVGERRTVRLPDGSQAMLNTDTRIAWRFDGSRDVWIERGEATLLVRNAGKPFRIYSDPIDARLSEGKFNIQIDPAVARLLVLAGRAGAAYRGTLAQTLPAGSMLTVSDGTARISALSPEAITTATAWERGEILFNGMTLDQAITEYNRYLRVKIVLQDAGLGTTRLGGTFRIAEPEAFLAALQEGFGIGHRQRGDQILLFRDLRT